MGRLARIAAVLLLLVLVVVVIGALTGRRAGPRVPAAPTLTTPTPTPTTTFLTTTTTTTTAQPSPAFPPMEEPFFTVSLETVAAAIPSGGGFEASLVFEGYNGFSGRVELEVVGVWYHTSDVGVGANLLRPGLVNVSAPRSVEVPVRASVKSELSGDAPLGKYSVVLTARGGGFASTVLIPFRVYAYPSYLIRPITSKPLVKAGEWTEITLRVEPIGPFNQSVSLEVKDTAWGVEAEILDGKGVPPFNATLRVRVEDVWRAMEENFTNTNLYVVVTGTPKGPSTIIWLGTEEVEQTSLLGTLLAVLTLPVRAVAGVALGVMLEFSYGLALPMVPPGAFLEAGMTATLPELMEETLKAPAGFEGATINNANHWTTYLKLGVASASKPASILAAAADVYVPSGADAALPILVYVDNPSAVEVEALRVWETIKVFPPEKEVHTAPANVTLEQGPGVLRGFIFLPNENVGNRLVVTVRDKATGRILDRVEIQTHTYNPPTIIIAAARPGETVIVPLNGLPNLRGEGPERWLAELSGNMSFMRPRPPIFRNLEGVAEATLYQSIEPDKWLPPSRVLDLEVRGIGEARTILLMRLKPDLEPGVYSSQTGELVDAQGRPLGVCIVHLAVLKSS